MSDTLNGDLIRRLRIKNKLTQVQLANRLGCHGSKISHIEAGRRGRAMQYPELLALAKALDTQVIELYGNATVDGVAGMAKGSDA